MEVVVDVVDAVAVAAVVETRVIDNPAVITMAPEDLKREAKW